MLPLAPVVAPLFAIFPRILLGTGYELDDDTAQVYPAQGFKSGIHSHQDPYRASLVGCDAQR